MNHGDLLQDINFYRAPQRNPLDHLLEFRLLVALLAVLLTAVLLARFWSAQTLRESQRELAAATAARDRAQAALDALQAERLVRQQSSGDAELQALTAVAAQLKEIKQHYRGFSARGNALALAHMPGIWLTRIYFENGSEPLLMLEGRVTDANLLPRYIAALGGAEPLQARSLYHVTLTDAGTEGARFALSNRPQAAPSAGER